MCASSVGHDPSILKIVLKTIPKWHHAAIYTFVFYTVYEYLYVSFFVLAMQNRYEEVVRSTAELVSKWQCVGFTHGVLNTDNMSLLGLTIDYGPYGFMDFFDPQFVPNGSDSGGRYSYEKQPEVSGAVAVRLRCSVVAVVLQQRCDGVVVAVQ